MFVILLKNHKTLKMFIAKKVSSFENSSSLLLFIAILLQSVISRFFKSPISTD